MVGCQVVAVTRLGLNRGFWSTLICITVKVMKDFFVITAVLCWSSKHLFSGFPLPLSKDLLSRSPFRRAWKIRVTSGYWLIFLMVNAHNTVLALQTLYLFSVSSYRREICLYIRLSKVPLTCNFQISLRQHLRSGLGMGKIRCGVVFAVLAKCSLSFYCSSLSHQGQKSLLLAGC